MASDNRDFKEDILDIINDRQQISFNELHDMAFSRGVSENGLKKKLTELESEKSIASRSNGGILTYYVLDKSPTKRVLIVEDDKNINRLMSLSIGKGFDISQLYDGGDVLQFVRTKRPNLVILDLMLPNKDGLDICQTIKSDPQLSDTIVILVSAMDPTSNRFKGIKYGADYYIKKPFDPTDLRNLVVIFLDKKGKRFDPLIDLPNEERISKEIDRYVKEGEDYVIGTLKIENLGAFARKIGEQSAIVILRLISQLLQDIIKNDNSIFVGFLNSEAFIVAGKRENTQQMISKVKQEFDAVLVYILQDAGYKPILSDIDSIFEPKTFPKPSLSYEESDRESIIKRREEILKVKNSINGDLGSYTYEEIQKMFADNELDIKITRASGGIRLNIGKREDEEV